MEGVGSESFGAASLSSAFMASKVVPVAGLRWEGDRTRIASPLGRRGRVSTSTGGGTAGSGHCPGPPRAREGRVGRGRRGVVDTAGYGRRGFPAHGCVEVTAGFAATDAQVFAGDNLVNGAHCGGPVVAPKERSSGGGRESGRDISHG
ncbi:hypothetical protein CEXT_111071 [Caerostris extrusa]|uniref:Uncharacterized protein n=1 Tax=Caerostris extrusa TaxID=172846 RepID=A0AAV4MWS2_CAEEX|nr:hypothetical protein CEXT_111071 [Caerostris extrusa]